MWLVLKFPKGFIQSEARPSLRFLGSSPKSGYRQSIAFHCGLWAGCRRNPSDFLLCACRVSFFASSPLGNNCLNLGIIGRCQHTFAGCRLFAIASTLHFLSFTLYHDTPHLGQLCIYVQNTIIRAWMNFLVLHSHWTWNLLCLVVILHQPVILRKNVFQ